LIPAVNIPNLQLIIPSSTLHRLTGALKYLRDTLFIFKTSHLHEAHYVLSPFQIRHSYIWPPHCCAIYVNPNFLAIPLHRVPLFTPCYNLLLCIIFRQLYHHTLHQSTVLSLYIYFFKTLLAFITILNIPFSSKHLSSHFLPISLWLILLVNNIAFFLQSLIERNEILRNDSANNNIHPQGDHKRQPASYIASTILRYH